MHFHLMVVAAVGMVGVMGCSTSGLDSPPVDGRNGVMVTMSGLVNGSVPAIMRVVYNPPSAVGETTMSILTTPNPGLGIEIFAYDALIAGMPEAIHYGEREAQITADIKMNDGRLLSSTVNSQNRAEIVAVTAGPTNPDRSFLYTLRGTAAGSVVASDSSDSVSFRVDF